MNERMARMDMGLFIASLLMLGFGVVLVYSSSFALAQQRFGGADFFLARQTMRALLAVISFMIVINIDYHIWGKMSNLIYLAAIVLLVAVLLLPDSHAINGAKRWITLGPISFQVSDLARMALIMVLSRNCSEMGEQIRDWSSLLKLMVKITIICLLVFFEPNFSTSALIGLIAFSILFISGARIMHLMLPFVVLVPVAAIMALSAPYRRARVIGFLHMAKRQDDLGYQTFQSLIGLGNGGLFGVGLGKGEQKFFYLPEPHTDFIFSILGEEIGFAGLLVVIGIFTFMVYRGMKAALNAPDKMGQIMAFGFTLVLALYALIHACVSTGLVPTTGVPLPFLSYGGMSLVFNMIAVGIILNISSQGRREVHLNVGQNIKSKKINKKR